MADEIEELRKLHTNKDWREESCKKHIEKLSRIAPFEAMPFTDYFDRDYLPRGCPHCHASIFHGRCPKCYGNLDARKENG